MQKFVKGRTNNHLTWVMVDATDFATPESALSAATKIKIYGKLRGATGVNFVSSGAGSLTNDIQHVGASALGIYTIALAKADLSDASAAWYDQYIISLSATGAAYQTLIVDGGIDESAISGFQSRLSDIASAVLVVQSMASDAASAAQQANSRVLLVLSNVSDVQSALTVVQSMASDAASAATQGNSRVLLVQSRLSDLDSRLASEFSDVYSRLSDMHSDLGSKIGAVTAVVSASDISDIASAVWANAIGARVDSRVLLMQSRLSDFDSRLVSDVSDIRSMLTALSDAISDAHSDLGSKIGAVTATVSASDMSDIASRVDVLLASRLSDILSAAQQANSRVLVTQSMISDTYSQLSNALSGPMTASDLSDIASAVWAHTIGARVDSRVLVVQSMASDAHSAAILGASHASDAASRALLLISSVSDLQSALSDAHSDLKSAIGNVSVALTASDISDIASAVAAAVTTVTASDISDIASAVRAILVSDLSDLLSRTTQINSRVLATQSLASDAHSAAAVGSSRALVNMSRISDVASQIAAGVPVSASDMSDLRSAIEAGGGASLLSDIYSAAVQVNSRVLLTQSRVSDLQSLAALIASNVSDVESQIDAGVEVGASSLSDLRSAITANGVLRAGAEPAGVIGHTDTLAAKIDWMGALSRNKVTQTAGVQSLRNDADTDTIASAAVSDDGTTATRGEWA